MKLFIVTLVVGLLDDLGTANDISNTSVVVEASSQENASIAAVKYFGDGVTKVTHIDNNDRQSGFQYQGDTGHVLFNVRTRIRYAAIRATAVSLSEVENFHSLTVGLQKGHVISGE